MSERPILGLCPGEKVSSKTQGSEKNLLHLLTKAQERRPVSIDGIHQDLRAIEAEIPIEFLVRTGLDGFNWQQIYDPNALSAVYLGISGKQTSLIKPSDSEAIIAVHSSVVGSHVKINNVELAVVVPDTQGRKRAASILYDAHSLEAKRGLVSIAHDEGSKFPGEEPQLIKIPRVANGSFFLPGPLVSSKMSQLAQGDSRMVEAFALDEKNWKMCHGGYEQGMRGDNIFIGRKKTAIGKEFLWKFPFPTKLTRMKSIWVAN